MPVKMELIENGHSFRYVISDPWKIADFTATFDEAKAILDVSPFPIHGVVNLLATARDPMGVLNVRKHPAFSHPNGGWTAFCHASMLAHRVTETALRLARFHRYKFFNTEAEGLAFVHNLIMQETMAHQTVR
jgi:hypothetical protein